jgi:hypothetical protein
VKVLKHRDRVDAAGTAVFVVHDDAQRVRDWMLRDLDMPYPVLVDTEMSSYKAWGLGWAGKLSALGPRIVLGYARKLLFEGERLHMGSEPLQLGGDFVVGPTAGCPTRIRRPRWMTARRSGCLCASFSGPPRVRHSGPSWELDEPPDDASSKGAASGF